MKACTKNIRAVVDSSVSSTVTATLTNNGSSNTASSDTYTLDIVVTRGTPTGSYNCTLETYMSRNGEDTTIYSDYMTLVVTEPAATTSTADSASSSTTTDTTTTTNATAVAEEVVSTVISNSKPYLEPEPSSTYEFFVGDVVEIYFGEPTDPYGNRIEPEVDLGSASAIFYVEDDSIKSFDFTATEAMIGNWRVKIKLSYFVGSEEVTKSYTINVQISESTLSDADTAADSSEDLIDDFEEGEEEDLE